MMIGNTSRMPQRLPRDTQWTSPSGSPAMPAMPFRPAMEMPAAWDENGGRFRQPQPLSVISADPAPTLSKLLWLAQVTPAKSTSGEDLAPRFGTGDHDAMPSDPAAVQAISAS